MTHHLVSHYRGFYSNQEALVMRADPPSVKSVLCLFRVAMTG
jgi:hypothetical protein